MECGCDDSYPEMTHTGPGTGVTFTYLGLRVDGTARVSTAEGPLANVWAAGEIMAGSITPVIRRVRSGGYGAGPV